MKKENRSDPCPLCGGARKPVTTISLADGRTGGAVVSKAPKAVGRSSGAESIDDKTANDFAEFVRNAAAK